MSPTATVCVNSNVIHDVISGEAILVNLANGRYYSLDKAGVDVWSLIEHGKTVGQIVDTLARKYAGTQAEIESGVRQLLEQLQTEDLVAPAETNGAVEGEARAEDLPSNGSDRPVFQTPILQTYTDMEALLLLDPIHDVDESGWPHKKSGSAET